MIHFSIAMRQWFELYLQSLFNTIPLLVSEIEYQYFIIVAVKSSNTMILMSTSDSAVQSSFMAESDEGYSNLKGEEVSFLMGDFVRLNKEHADVVQITLGQLSQIIYW